MKICMYLIWVLVIILKGNEKQLLVQRHNKTLAPHNKTLAPHNKTLAPHNKTLASHNKTLAPHNKTLAPHFVNLATGTPIRYAFNFM